MRKEIIATLSISTIWAIAGFLTAASAQQWGYGIAVPDYKPPFPDPYSLGIVLGFSALILTFIVIRTMLPSRATQRRKLMHLLDEIGVEDIDAIQRKLNALSTLDDSQELEQVASLSALLQEQKRKNSAD